VIVPAISAKNIAPPAPPVDILFMNCNDCDCVEKYTLEFVKYTAPPDDAALLSLNTISPFAASVDIALLKYIAPPLPANAVLFANVIDDIFIKLAVDP
jgi:hypothetical protein